MNDLHVNPGVCNLGALQLEDQARMTAWAESTVHFQKHGSCKHIHHLQPHGEYRKLLAGRAGPKEVHTGPAQSTLKGKRAWSLR